LTIEALHRSVRVRAFGEFDEGETTGATCFPVDGQDDLRRRGDGAEMGAEVGLGRAVRQVTDEQTDSQFSVLLE
jgi:hypothetical protein